MDGIISALSYRLDVSALCAGVLVALCAAMLGVILMLKRRPLYSGGVGGVGFAAASLSLALGLPVIYISVPAVLCAALLLVFAVRKGGASGGDAAGGITAASAFSAAVLITALSGDFSTELFDLAFGSIAAMNCADTLISAASAVVLIILFIPLKNRIFLVALNEGYAGVCGLNTALFRFLIAVMTALVVLIGMKLMGALMLPSLIIFPAMAAVRLTRGFKMMLAAAGLISVFCFICGALIAAALEVPDGAAAACVNAAALLAVSLARRCRGDAVIYR